MLGERDSPLESDPGSCSGERLGGPPGRAGRAEGAMEGPGDLTAYVTAEPSGNPEQGPICLGVWIGRAWWRKWTCPRPCTKRAGIYLGVNTEEKAFI